MSNTQHETQTTPNTAPNDDVMLGKRHAVIDGVIAATRRATPPTVGIDERTFGQQALAVAKRGGVVVGQVALGTVALAAASFVVGFAMQAGVKYAIKVLPGGELIAVATDPDPSTDE